MKLLIEFDEFENLNRISNHKNIHRILIKPTNNKDELFYDCSLVTIEREEAEEVELLNEQYLIATICSNVKSVIKKLLKSHKPEELFK